MSPSALSDVWAHSPAKGGPLLVEMALADHAHDDGTNAYPAVKTLAHKARLSERCVQYALRQLEACGEIEATGISSDGTVVYAIRLRGRRTCRGAAKRAPEEQQRHVVEADASTTTEPSAASEPSSLEADVQTATAAKDKPSAAERNDNPECVRLADLLADLIAANRDGRRPKDSEVAKWREPIRLMVERDELSVAQIEGAIGWCQRDHFWRAVILSAGALRRNYEKLEAQARRKRVSAKADGNAGVLARIPTAI